MKRCPFCAQDVQEAAIKCQFCGETLPLPTSALLAEVAKAEITVKALLLDVPAFVCAFAGLLRSPVGYFRELAYGEPDIVRRSMAFMLQGTTLAFIILTAGWALAQMLTGVAVLSGSADSPEQYTRRSQALKAVLPAGLAREFLGQRELVLVAQALSDEQFQRLTQRLQDMATTRPDLLERAVRGTPPFDDRHGSRQRILFFFFALHPRTGALMENTQDLVSLIPAYALKPHVDFLVRTVLLWSITGAAVSWLLRRRGSQRSTWAAFVIGAYLVGFLGPLVQLWRAATSLYAIATLPGYAQALAAVFLVPGTAGPAGDVPSQFALFLLERSVPVAAIVLAIVALAAGTRTAWGVSRTRATSTAVVGVMAGLAAMDVVGNLIVIVLAPTGLV